MKFDEPFKGFRPLTDDERKQVWANAWIVFDSNILLDLYRLETSRNDYLALLGKIKDRLFIPYRVLTEFIRNRPSVIKNHFAPNKLIQDHLDSLRKKLSDEHGTHPDLDRLLKSVERMKQLEREEFGKKEAEHKSLLKNDPILDQLRAIIGDSVGDPIEQAKIEEEYTKREKSKIPPYCEKDAKKQAGIDPAFGDDLRQGDVAIWIEILQKCKGDDKPLIFVTGDGKGNWWASGGDGTIPHGSLAKEFFRETKKDLLFYDFGGFYKDAIERLAVEKSEPLMKESEEIERRQRSETMRQLSKTADFANLKVPDVSGVLAAVDRKYAMLNPSAYMAGAVRASAMMPDASSYLADLARASVMMPDVSSHLAGAARASVMMPDVSSYLADVARASAMMPDVSSYLADVDHPTENVDMPAEFEETPDEGEREEPQPDDE